MAYNNRYQYETSPRKLQPEYETIKKKYPKKSTARRNKQKIDKKAMQKKKQHKRTIVYLAVAFSILFGVSYRNAIISESFKQTKELKSKLATIQKENEQLKVNIESSLNLKNIEQVAKTELEMSKLDPSKTVYINLPREDYIEAASEEVKLEEEKNWFQEVIDMIINKIK